MRDLEICDLFPRPLMLVKREDTGQPQEGIGFVMTRSKTRQVTCHPSHLLLVLRPHSPPTANFIS